MSTNLFIPTTIRVGFQERDGTFTGKLAYIIYYDEKGKIRKEVSWTGWRDDDIPAIEFTNEPNSGYIFNKGVKRDGYWGSGRSVIRVYDPRDFEFEITVDNLIGILMHSDVSKRDITEPCVFAWRGADLVLLPTNSLEYTTSLEYTAKQSMKVSARDLVVGRQYEQKKHNSCLTYIGRYEWYILDTDYNHPDGNYSTVQKCKGKKHIFVDHNGEYYPTPVSQLSCEVGDHVVDNIAHLVDNYIHSDNAQRICGVSIGTVTNGNDVIKGEDRHQSMCLCQTVGFIYVVVRLCWYNFRKLETIDSKDLSISVSFYKKVISTTGIVSMVNISRRYISPYHNTTNKFASRASISHQLTKSITDAGLDASKTTMVQIYAAMVRLGYGNMTATLTDGSVVPYNI